MTGRQEQRASDNARAIQASGDVVIYEGISEERAHEIARHAVEGELERFERTAFHIAAARTEQLRTELIDRFRTEPSAQLGAFEDPDVQMLLTDAQREYVRSGADEHRAALIDLITARTKVPAGGMQASVIRSAVQAVPRMTSRSIPLATLSWLMTNVRAMQVQDRSWLAEWAEDCLAPFTQYLPATDSEFQFMESLGVGSIQLTESNLSDVIGTRYSGIFQTGKPLDAFNQELVQEAETLNAQIFMLALDGQDANSVQLRALNNEVAEDEFRALGASQDAIDRYKSELANNRKGQDEIESMLRAAHPAWGALLDSWSSTVMRNFRLNFVGFAIAHCHFTNVTGQSADLAVWVPE